MPRDQEHEDARAWALPLNTCNQDMRPHTHPGPTYTAHTHSSNRWPRSIPELVPPLHMPVPPSWVPERHYCSPLPHVRPGLTCMCPTCCQPSTESGRVCLLLAPSIDGWVCFPCVFWVQGEKKKGLQMSFSWGAFPFIFFCPGVSEGNLIVCFKFICT